MNNVAKAKAALTACRAVANSIYIGPLLQASMDLQVGSISSEECDYKKSYSCLFEGFDGLKDARVTLKYMLLGKIMNEQPGDVKAVLAGKLALKYAGGDSEAAAGQAMDVMQEITASYEKSDLGLFEEIAEERGGQLRADLVICNKLQELKDKLLEQNLLRLLEPFEQVEMAHIVALIKLQQATIYTHFYCAPHSEATLYGQPVPHHVRRGHRAVPHHRGLQGLGRAAGPADAIARRPTAPCGFEQDGQLEAGAPAEGGRHHHDTHCSSFNVILFSFVDMQGRVSHNEAPVGILVHAQRLYNNDHTNASPELHIGEI